MLKLAIAALSALVLATGHLEEGNGRRLRFGIRPSPEEMPGLRPDPNLARRLAEEKWAKIPLPEIRPLDREVEASPSKVARETGVKAEFAVGIKPEEVVVSSIANGVKLAEEKMKN